MRALLVVLCACGAASSSSSSLRPPSPGVPPSIWRAPAMNDGGDGCEPWWFAPAVYCDAGEHQTPMVYSGCVWHCPALPELVAVNRGRGRS